MSIRIFYTSTTLFKNSTSLFVWDIAIIGWSKSEETADWQTKITHRFGEELDKKLIKPRRGPHKNWLQCNWWSDQRPHAITKSTSARHDLFPFSSGSRLHPYPLLRFHNLRPCCSGCGQFRPRVLSREAVWRLKS